MYNLSNLNDYEFEMLCKDIMEKKLSVNLHRFAKGQDGGVDLCDSKSPMHHMIQAKHYINSKYSNLKTSLKREIAKVKKENPKNYYICCSIELNPKQRKEIHSFFSDYMKDISYIIDKTEIDDFLSKEENKDIVARHHKLWLCSTNILSLVQNQNIFIDCNEILKDIEKYTKLFVTTNAYYECRNKLLDKNIIIITGTPGVGKSTISKMLLLFFASENFTVRYVSDNNLKDIKNILNKAPAQKEIILLDDFLGQHYLKLNEKQPNELKTLISYVERNSNKKIIMNSRITIINEARVSSIDFSKLVEEYEEDNYLIDLDKMSKLEKAEILYNHFYFNKLPIDYFIKIKENKNYRPIIKHENYNPRIIEYITNEKNYLVVEPKNYIKYIFEKLDNPTDVWEDEFRNRLEENDRVLMNTLYSLTNTKIEMSILENAFNKRVKSLYSDTTLYIFDEVINRLTNSLLRIIVEKNKQYISVINPSLNDYLNKKIAMNKLEQIAIINNAYYIEQLERFKENKQTILDFIYSNQISKLSSIDNNFELRYFNFLILYELKNLRIAKNVRSIFNNYCKTSFYRTGDIIIELIEKGYVDYYDLKSIIINNLENVLDMLVFDNLILLYNWNTSINGNLSNNESELYKKAFISAIEEYIIDIINDVLQEIVDEEINNIKEEIEIQSDVNSNNIINVYADKYYPFIENIIIDQIDNELIETLKKTPININLSEISFNNIFSNINIEEAIKSNVENEYNEARAELYMDDYKFYKEKSSDWDIIDKIFN